MIKKKLAVAFHALKEPAFSIIRKSSGQENQKNVIFLNYVSTLFKHRNENNSAYESAF